MKTFIKIFISLLCFGIGIFLIVAYNQNDMENNNYKLEYTQKNNNNDRNSQSNSQIMASNGNIQSSTTQDNIDYTGMKLMNSLITIILME